MQTLPPVQRHEQPEKTREGKRGSYNSGTTVASSTDKPRVRQLFGEQRFVYDSEQRVKVIITTTQLYF
jgi:hypothetical protein